jgi:diguanylate cyclase (GGDEF)-like protein/PAS domain S-box-containing protein
MTGHDTPRWAGITLFFVFLARLAATGMFDASLATPIGGPYGLTALLIGLSLASAGRFADAVAPVRELWPRREALFHWSLVGVVVLSALAYLGLPLATVATDVVVLAGTALIATYLVHRGRLGSQAARVASPSAAVFALVALAAALGAIGALGDSLLASDAAGGFAAAGAVLLALAVAAGEGISAHPLLAGARAGDTSRASLEGDASGEATDSPKLAADTLHAVSASRQGVFDLDLESGILKLSGDAAALIGLGAIPVRVRHDGWLARIHAEDRDVYVQALDGYREQAGLSFRIEFRARSQTGRYNWFELRATMMGSGGRATRCLGLLADVTVRKQTEAALVDRTLRDPLTGLGNRVALMEELEQLGARFKDATFAILDIDRFKSIHASLGDAGGDAVLAQVADRLVSGFGKAGEVFRVGGDAFAVLFAQCPDEPMLIGEELVQACGTAFAQDGRSVFAPVSVGMTVGADAEDPLDLLKNAELALIQAKRQGGGCARVYARELEALAPGDAVTLEAELRRALDEKQLDVFYQPIIRLADGSVAGFEALLRWHHPTKGVVAPSDFIAHSEETGLIVALGQYALERATRELAHWQRFFPLNPSLFVSVNVSRRQLRDGAVESLLASIFAKGEIRRGTLKLEITESSIAAHRDLHEILRRLRALGAGLAIDDFGTGVSSLSQLKDLPFDTVKIDKSFLVRHGGTHDDAEGSVILTSIVSLAHELKRSVVVEGVENEQDAAWLKELGCEFAQGFHFAVPLPANEALDFIAMHYDTEAAKAPPPIASGAPYLRGKS